MEPGTLPFIAQGSTSYIIRSKNKPGYVVKTRNKQIQRIDHLEHEAWILGHLNHVGIIKCDGLVDRTGLDPAGLLLEEASAGDLQRFLEEHPNVDYNTKLDWCIQIAEAVEYIHSQGVIHCDMRGENILVGENQRLILCDFGGSTLGDRSGGGWPDSGFCDPKTFDGRPASPAIDIFSLGSVVHLIITGSVPHHDKEGLTSKYEKDAWADKQFELGVYPDLSTLQTRDVIQGCWDGRFKVAAEVVSALKQFTTA